MIVVADSGSTKTDWRVIDKGIEVSQIKTGGINPYYMSVGEINTLVEEGFEGYKDLNIEQVNFYGSGCSSDKNKQIIQDAVSLVYPSATVIVQHDLIAASRSLCGSERGIACILGTGSNSALYDGKEIVENVTSLGYMLGDEGSGNHLGRCLIQAYFKGRLSDVVKRKFDEQFELTTAQILEHIYQRDLPVRFFANFSKFITENIEDDSLYRLVYNSFASFITENIIRYTGYQSETIHFTGSIAYYYKSILTQCCQDYDLKLGQIVKEPIGGLLSFHK